MLQFKDPIGLQGRLKVKIENVITGEIKEIVEDNLVILTGRNLIRDFLFGDPVSGLTHMAVGTDTSDPSVTPGITEVFRKQLTSKVKADAKLTVDMYLSSQEANGNVLTSAALFGNGATNTGGTGTQYNKIIHDAITKDNSVAVTYTWDLFFNS
jgi:hypothetical protein